MPQSTRPVESLAKLYTEAWCSGDPSRVAGFYSPTGSLSINGRPPAVGREAITQAAQEFMTAFPDMKVAMDGLSVESTRARFRWTLTGTNTGPGGSGKRISISGFEQWTLGDDGFITESQGHFDEAEYQRQLR
jgi:predicted ester cyclase